MFLKEKKSRLFKFSKLIYLLGLAFFYSCGSTPPSIGDQAVSTPDYRENKVLFAQAPDTSDAQLRELKHTYELEDDNDREIKRLAPIGCILRGVRIPEELEDTRDIAVVLDIVTAGAESVTSLVAFYQRNVPGGQMLNFQDLLVYYDPEWDGVTPPWFRVRVLEVNSERNTRTQAFLNQSSKLSAGLAGVVPHPVLPSVKTAIEAAKLIFGNKKNKILIDYQVQFYSPSQIRGSRVKLTPLRKGEWIVVGREKEATSNFWNKDLVLNQRTQRILSKQDNKHLQVPYVSIVLMSADASVPKHIMDRSLVLLELLESSSERNNFDALDEAVSSLSSSLDAYKLERQVKKYRSSADFKALVNKIDEFVNEKAQNNPAILKIGQIRSLVRLVNELTGESFGTAEEVSNWWHKKGGDIGKFEETIDLTKYPHGTKWVWIPK